MLRLRILTLLLVAFGSVGPNAQAPGFTKGNPEAVGCDAAGLGRAAEVISELVTKNEVRGAVVLVARGRTIVLHRAFGSRDLDGKIPMGKDTLFRMASNTKAVTAAAILALAEDGKLSIDDPVSKFLPSFGKGEAAKITIRHLLTHTSGLRIGTLFVQPLMQKSPEHPDAPNLVLEAARFGEVGPEAEPGKTYAYSNPGYNTLAAIVELVSGEGFEPFCSRRFYLPLGMRDTCNHESQANPARMSTVMRRDDAGKWSARWTPGDPPTVPFVRGSGGLISTATDFGRFCRLWLDDGMCGDRSILSPQSVQQATSVQTPQIEGVRYGFGWQIDDDGQFSHGGSDGTWVWCDRPRDLVGMVLTQTQSSKALEKARGRFRDLVAVACPPQQGQGKR